MASIGKSVNVIVNLNGKELAPPLEWFDVGVLASFEEQVQANISTDKFTFVRDAYKEIKDHIEGGLTGSTVGIFEGLPLSFTTFNNDTSYLAFDGFVDLQNDIQINDTTGRIEASLKKLNGLNTFGDSLEGLTYEFLVEKGIITDADYTNVDYVVQKLDATTEALIASLTAYLLFKELYETSRRVGEIFSTGSGIAAVPPFGAVGALVYNAAIILINILYIALIANQIATLIRNIVNTLIPPLRTHKCISFKKLLEKACQHLGYNFNSTITELDNYYYLPSNINTDEFDNKGFFKKAGTIEQGIANSTDYGYLASEIFELCLNMFRAKYVISKDTVEFHAEVSDYWIKQSSFMIPDVLEGSYSYNTNELNSNIFLAFTTDIIDEYTIENFTGTNYQVITDAKTVVDERKKTIIGLGQTTFPIALGNRKEKLSGIENFVAGLAEIADGLLRTLGKRSNLRDSIKNKIGVLKVSNNYHSIPKVLYLENGRIPPNHREKLSAKYLWDNFHIYDSFVERNYKRQRKTYESVKIPFGLLDFSKLIENSYFYTEDGRVGKMERIEWKISQDYAICSYWIEEVYTKNLQETKIEP